MLVIDREFLWVCMSVTKLNLKLSLKSAVLGLLENKLVLLGNT